MSFLKYFWASFALTLGGLILGFLVGLLTSGTLEAGLNSLFITAILGILEVSLSFDNAVVNVTVLETMSLQWQRRFLTWGILIAVVGMRLILPIVVVAISGHMTPLEALRLAAFQPERYAYIMKGAHVMVAGFGGAFLLSIALKYFFDVNKSVHWIRFIERPLIKIGKMDSFDIALTLIVCYLVSLFLPNQLLRTDFLAASIFGVITYVIVDGLGELLQPSDGNPKAAKTIARAGVAGFVYLEVLDASFSFDGVIGAFALTSNLFIITIGLGIGAVMIRSLTVYMAEKKLLTSFIFLEHGAFYAIAALAILMILSVVVPVPEWITGMLGAAFIGVAFVSSVRFNRMNAKS